MSLIQEAYESVHDFNDIAGNFKNVDDESISNQLLFIDEEFNETCEAFFKNDGIELLDGVCDIFVTVAGLMQKLFYRGYNVNEALTRVCENNMSKFPSVADGCEHFKEHIATLNCDYHSYVIKDSSGKIRKPSNFVPVDIRDCVPKEFGGTL